MVKLGILAGQKIILKTTPFSRRELIIVTVKINTMQFAKCNTTQREQLRNPNRRNLSKIIEVLLIY